MNISKTPLNITNTALTLLLFLTASFAHAAGWSGNVAGYLGNKSLDNNDWSEFKSQGAVGVIFDFKLQDWPVNIAIDTIISGDTNKSGAQEDTGYSIERHFGIRKIFRQEGYSFKPYFGGGLAFILAGIERKNSGSTVVNEDKAVGTWVGVGSYFEFKSGFQLGLDLRYSTAEATISNIKRDVGGLHSGITAGYHW